MEIRPTRHIYVNPRLYEQRRTAAHALRERKLFRAAAVAVCAAAIALGISAVSFWAAAKLTGLTTDHNAAPAVQKSLTKNLNYILKANVDG